MEEIENQLLHHWQTSKFKSSSSNCLHLKADDLRTRLAHLSFAETLQTQTITNDPIIKTVMKDLLSEYAALIDSEDEGLNSYQDQILYIAEGKKLENEKWTSGLTFENICELDEMQTLINATKKNPNSSPKPKAKPKPKPKPKTISWKCDIGKVSPVKVRETSPIKRELSRPTSPSKTLHPTRPSKTLHHERKINYPKRPQLNQRKLFPKRKKAVEFDDDEPQTDSSCDQFASNAFCTAKEQLITDCLNNKETEQVIGNQSYGTLKKTLGARRNVGTKFIPPILNRESDAESFSSLSTQSEGALKNIEPKMIEMIENEIMDHGSPVSWDDIAGLQFAKAEIKEVIVWPMLRPDLFTGLRSVPKGILLFGPPGTGKTMIGKCIASQSKSVFFSISASSLTSKWVGEGEKMVKCLFAVARSRQPAVIFIDEIDSLLTQRSESEHESSRRIKTEFLIQLDGASTNLDERVLVIGATNRPQELDEAARRRLVKRLFIPLPDLQARKEIVLRLLSKHQHSITNEQALDISVKTEGYSGADMANLCRAAALGPIRSIDFNLIEKIQPNEVRPINYDDFADALRRVKTSVSDQNMKEYMEWNYKYGSEA